MQKVGLNFDGAYDECDECVAPVAWADFDQNYQPINSGYPAAAPSSYVVTKGQSLRVIAQAVWGDASLWYLIAEANGLVGTEVPTAGMTRVRQ